ncbi:run domain Beclin-1-interacting and cysteine-rich domain-containing protein-like isoform X2 [Conger conger]|uniref:run domain Beclin-1-interacting and cysteine-rich domain-containing protein-like isoform X2 n=1 Tax=Conger conger TaxID=82655 RepID=UPI002A5A7800|nr:run domain Beclin-1-interacting and cysteine-rich domain-containing protein-like isoform X2 [Conger conger]
MEITETDVSVRRREHRRLLCSLKRTAEGLLSSDPYGWGRRGLQRLHTDMHRILSHRLEPQHVSCRQTNYWRFVWCVRYICPHLAFHVEQFGELELASSGTWLCGKGHRVELCGEGPTAQLCGEGPTAQLCGEGPTAQLCGEGHKAHLWLLHSLQERCLSVQLRPLLKHQSHTRKYYRAGAFVLSELQVSLMLQCLEAVEQNDWQLLSLVDPLRLPDLQKSRSLCVFPGPPHLTSAEPPLFTSTSDLAASFSEEPPGVPWECGANSAIPQIWLTEPRSPVQDPGPPAAPADGAQDPGPQYLAVHSSRRRRPNSYSEGQSRRGHTHLPSHIRSVSDTTVTLTHSNESGAEVCAAKGGAFSSLGDVSTCSMSSEGSQCSSVSEGMLYRPLEGQSLLSFLTERDFSHCKENAHFIISESLIAAMELLKWRLREDDEDEDEEEESPCSGCSGETSQDSLLLDPGLAEEVEPCGQTGSDFKHSVTCFSSKSSLSSESICARQEGLCVSCVAMAET